MKAVKKALLGMSVAGVLVVSAGMGTYSWFTSETNASGEVVNGTLQINNGVDITTPVVLAEKFAPSQLQFGDWITVENTGNLKSLLRATYTHSVDIAPVQKYKVGYYAIKYIERPGEDEFKKAQIELDQLFKGTTNPRDAVQTLETDNIEIVSGIISEEDLAEMVAKSGNSKEIVLGDGSLDGKNDKFWNLKHNEYIDIMFGVKLSEKAGNEYQGASYTADFKVKAKQIDEGAEYAE